jgi:hypothetical protein
MYGIELKSGVNNCYWNIDGKCTNIRVTRNSIPQAFARDWDSKQNCTLTILGVHKCGGYTPQKV